MNISNNLIISGYKQVKRTGNPDQDAQNFAQANNISLNEAKSVLSSNFGNPSNKECDGFTKSSGTIENSQQSKEGMGFNETSDLKNAYLDKLRVAGFSEEAINALKMYDNDIKIQQEAMEKGIQIPKR